MSLWSKITAAVEALRAGEPLSAVFDQLRTPPERSIAFTIGVLALGAKLAKADGTVTRDEVAVFRSVFIIAVEDEKHAARVFNLARKDVAGYDAYARKLAGLFPPGDKVLVDLLEGLFLIAMADGDYHPAEEAFLCDVADIFGISEQEFRRIAAVMVPGAEPDPFDVLGLSPDATRAEAEAAWKRLVRAAHPDSLRARGVPQEAVLLAEEQLKALNHAWDEVEKRIAA